jgi:hypothetical protein
MNIEIEAEEDWIVSEEWDEAVKKKAPDIINLDKEEKSWVPYQGPEGGDGWQNIDSGDIVYQDEPPGDTNVDPDAYHDADADTLRTAIEEVTGEELGEEWKEMSAEEVREAVQEMADMEQMSDLMDELSGDTGSGDGSVNSDRSQASTDFGDPSEMSVQEQADTISSVRFEMPDPGSVDTESLRKMRGIREFMSEADDEALSQVIVERAEDGSVPNVSAISHLEPDTARELADEVLEQVEGSNISSYVTAFGSFVKDPEAREDIIESHAEKINDLRERQAEIIDTDWQPVEETDNWYKLQMSDDPEEWREAFLTQYVNNGTTDRGVMSIMASMMDLDVNQNVSNWTGGYPVSGDIQMSDRIRENIQSLKEESTDEIEEPKTVYRGLKQDIGSHSQLESWTTDRETAEKFIGQDGTVIEGEIEPEDVFISSEEAEWPAYKDDEEYIVFGGAF